MMIDFALEAQRVEGMNARDAIYHACLLRLRPILMTTVAAMFGALPLMLGHGRRLGAAPSARPRHRRRPRGQPGADAVHDAGDLSLLRAHRRGARLLRRAAARSRRRRREQPVLRAVHPPAGRDDAADDRHRASRACSRSGNCRSRRCRRSISRPFRCTANMPGASPTTWRPSVAAPLEKHLGQIADVTEMTSQSSLGNTRITLQFGLDRDIDGAARDVEAAINAARADLPTSLQAEPDLSQGQSGRRADHGAGADLDDAAARPALRRRLQRAAAAAVAARRHRRGRRRAAARCPACGSSSIPARCSTTASASKTCARRSPRPTPTARRARSRTPISTIRSTPTIRRARPRNIAISSSPIATARRSSSATSPRSSIRSRICATPASPTASRRSASILSREPGANIIQAVDGVKAELPRLIASLPGDVDLTVVVDRSITIRGSLARHRARR